jgi:hypothetical protein
MLTRTGLRQGQAVVPEHPLCGMLRHRAGVFASHSNSSPEHTWWIWRRGKNVIPQPVFSSRPYYPAGRKFSATSIEVKELWAPGMGNLRSTAITQEKMHLAAAYCLTCGVPLLTFGNGPTCQGDFPPAKAIFRVKFVPGTYLIYSVPVTSNIWTATVS